MGAAYSSFGQIKVLYATSLVLLGAKAKFLRRKWSVLGTAHYLSVRGGGATKILIHYPNFG